MIEIIVVTVMATLTIAGSAGVLLDMLKNAYWHRSGTVQAFVANRRLKQSLRALWVSVVICPIWIGGVTAYREHEAETARRSARASGTIRLHVDPLGNAPLQSAPCVEVAPNTIRCGFNLDEIEPFTVKPPQNRGTTL
jgi:hypothetical protein